jgi:hypothetical protein
MYNNQRSRQIIERDYTIWNRQSWSSNRFQISKRWLVWEWLFNWNTKDSLLINDWTAINVIFDEGGCGYIKQTADFNGANAMVYIPHNSIYNFTNQFSISYSINIDVFEEWKWIIWKWSEQPTTWTTNQFTIITKSVWKVGFYLNTWTITSFDNTTTLNTWERYDIIHTYDWVFMSTYINWILDWTLAKTWNMVTTWTLQRIEVWTYASNILDQYLNWKIQLLRIYNIVISEKEINKIHLERLKLLH